jgi:hypothetical protein
MSGREDCGEFMKGWMEEDDEDSDKDGEEEEIWLEGLE